MRSTPTNGARLEPRSGRPRVVPEPENGKWGRCRKSRATPSGGSAPGANSRRTMPRGSSPAIRASTGRTTQPRRAERRARRPGIGGRDVGSPRYSRTDTAEGSELKRRCRIRFELERGGIRPADGTHCYPHYECRPILSSSNPRKIPDKPCIPTAGLARMKCYYYNVE